MPYNCNQYHGSRRKADRFKTHGIVALTSFEKPIAASIYDIALGGVSFITANEMEICRNEFRIEILIFNSLTDFEYLISQVMVRVIWKGLVFDPEIHKPIWRFNVEYIDLDSLQQRKLQGLYSLEQQPMTGFSTSIYKKYHTLHEKHETYCSLKR